MGQKKSLKASLTRISRSKVKTDKPVYQMLRGIESKIEFHPFLEDWGNSYQSLLRTALNDRQKGLSETEIEKAYQKRFNIQWAWADSLATLASSTYNQLTTAKTLQIEQIETDLKTGLVKSQEILEQLEFSKKKACLRHSPQKYNRMLSGFVYDKFRSFLVARAEKYGIEVIFKNPFATSVIGMIKYMPKYGLNSAYAAAMVIARRALGFSERIPRSYLSLIGVCPESPADGFGHSWSQWGKICKLLNSLYLSRHQMFTQMKVLEVLHDAVSRSGKIISTSISVVSVNSSIDGESPMTQNC